MSLISRALRLTTVAALLVIGSLTTPATAQATTAADNTITGGQPVYFGSVRCLTGFSVQHHADGDGFVTFGGCGSVGQQVGLTPGGEPIGVVRAAATAWLYVDLYDGWTAEPRVAGQYPVDGTTQAPVGSAVCRSGSTTGWHCGTITAHNVTITYPQGTVTGVSRTNLCPEPGELGGPTLSGGQAQGIVLGGSGNCASGGVTYYYPVPAIASAAGVTVKTT